MKRKKMSLAVLVICLCSSNLIAGIYSWTDENGIKHYSNTAPPQEAAVTEEIQASNSDEVADETAAKQQSGESKKDSLKTVNEPVDKSMALRIAANAGNLEEVKRLLSGGADIDARAENGMTPLILASWRGHTKVVELLLREGADVNAETNIGTTALKFATERGQKKTIALLRSHGARE
jgi:ankyrin repeat protein